MKSQFDFFTDLANSVWEGGSDDGEPIVNAGLQNPPPSNIDGTFSRRFILVKPDSQSNYWGRGNIVASIKTSLVGGAYDAPDDTKALDLRFSANSYDDNPRGGNVGVACRYLHDSGRASPLQSYIEAFDGYGMSFGPVLNLGGEEHNGNGNNPAVQYLRLWARKSMSQIGNNGSHQTELRIAANPVTQAAWLPKAFYRFRFIFVPVADLSHVLIAQVLNSYTADEGVDNNWTEAGRITISAAFDPWYLPPEAGQRVGWYTAQNAKEYYSNTPNMLFDNFYADIADADGSGNPPSA